MPSQPLIDLETLDLSRIVATRDDILAKIKQRGRFALLDGILHVDPAGEQIVGFKEIRGEDWWAADHIPGRPIFPGALMCEAAAQLCPTIICGRRRSRTAASSASAGWTTRASPESCSRPARRSSSRAPRSCPTGSSPTPRTA